MVNLMLSYERRHQNFLRLPVRFDASMNTVGFLRNLEVNNDITNSPLGGGVMHTFTLLAGTLRANKDYLTVYYAGDFTANANNKLVQAFFDGTAYATGAAIAIAGSEGWIVEARITRLTATSVRIAVEFKFNAIFTDPAAAPTSFGSGAGLLVRNQQTIACANLDSNAIVMDCVGLGTAVGDVIQNETIIEVCQR